MKLMKRETTKKKAPEALLLTGQVGALLGVSEQRVQTVLRSTPGLRPPVVAGKRRWRPEDVRALRERLALDNPPVAG